MIAAFTFCLSFILSTSFAKTSVDADGFEADLFWVEGRGQTEGRRYDTNAQLIEYTGIDPSQIGRISPGESYEFEVTRARERLNALLSPLLDRIGVADVYLEEFYSPKIVSNRDPLFCTIIFMEVSGNLEQLSYTWRNLEDKGFTLQIG